MIHTLSFLFVLAMLVFSYRWLRNGIPLKSGNFLSRLFWGLGFALSYILMSLPDTNVWVAVLYVPLQFLAMLVPHAWVQNMGLWPSIQKRWPGFFLPTSWPQVWVPGSVTATLHDFLGMAGVGLFRGLIVFLPTALVGASLTYIVAAVAITMLGQPMAYLIGRFVKPLGGEFFVGVAWALTIF